MWVGSYGSRTNPGNYLLSIFCPRHGRKEVLVPKSIPSGFLKYEMYYDLYFADFDD